MSTTAQPITGLVTEPALLDAWQASVPGARLAGIAGAVAGNHGTVVVVSLTPVDDAAVAAATPGLAAVLGVRTVEVVLPAGQGLAELVRDWTYQAAQGSGRGVHVKVRGDAGSELGDTGPVRVLVRAIDSSAREVAFRLASPQESALPALRALLGGREVTVRDEETEPQ
jgi:hypothetical protein